jgi:hypothetical protein
MLGGGRDHRASSGLGCLVFAFMSVSRGSREGGDALVPLMGICGLTCVSYKELTKCVVAWCAGR